MGSSTVEWCVRLHDAAKVRGALAVEPNEIHCTTQAGSSLLHLLVSDYDPDDKELCRQDEKMLNVLFEFNINPTIRSPLGNRTAKEFAEHLALPQQLINKLADYEEQWEAKHSPFTSAPTSHCRRRHQAAATLTSNTSTPSAYSHQVHAPS